MRTLHGLALVKLTIGIGVLLVSLGSGARASPSEGGATDPRVDHSRLVAIVGLATPVGELGIEGAYVVEPRLEVAAGLGAASLLSGNDSGSPHLQLAVMPRYRLRLGRARVTLGVGVSGGEYVVASSPFSGDRFVAKTRALWLNGEVGVQYVVGGGVFTGIQLGYGAVIAHGEVRDPDNRPTSLRDDMLPSLSVAVGYAF